MRVSRWWWFPAMFPRHFRPRSRGQVCILEKPVNPHELVKVVEALLRARTGADNTGFGSS